MSEGAGETVLCAASAYNKKFFLNPLFDGMPQQVKDELKIMCVLFTEDVGGILQLAYNEEGDLELKASSAEGDLLYDEIGCGLKIRELQRTRRELLEGLELYYKILFLGRGGKDDADDD